MFVIKVNTEKKYFIFKMYTKTASNGSISFTYSFEYFCPNIP